MSVGVSLSVRHFRRVGHRTEGTIVAACMTEPGGRQISFTHVSWAVLDSACTPS